MESNFKTITNIIKGYFNLMPDKEKEEETIQAISSGVVFHGANLWVLIFAILIASLGLNVNSTAVIIGAMLISPLMGPIIGMGLAIGINDLELLKSSVKNYLVATIISVATAAIYFLITPLDEAQSELLARTSPTLYDVLIALCGGAAGIVALATKGKGNVLPGVAIATALMPPLCTAGYGIAMGNISYFLGAFYLFFINTVFISLATFLGVRMMKFKHKRFVNKEKYNRVRKYMVIIIILTMVPAIFMTISIVKKSIFNNNVNNFIEGELSFNGTQIISENIDNAKHTIRVVAVGKEIPTNIINEAQSKMEKYNLEDYRLAVIQGVQSDSILMLSNKLNNIKSSNADNSQQLLEQSQHIRTLETQLDEYTRYDKMSTELRGEFRVLFPKIKSISLSPVVQAHIDTTSTNKYVAAIMSISKGTKISNDDRKKLHDWLISRTKTDSLRIIITTSDH